MNLFHHFNWLRFIFGIFAGFFLGVALSFSIFINIKFQNKFINDSSFISNFLQFLVYLLSVGFFLFLSLYVGIVKIYAQPVSLVENLFSSLAILFPVVMAFRLKFIPERKERSQSKEK